MAADKPKKKKILLSFVTTIRESSERVWLTIYADLMTNLMLFFLMLFAVSRLSLDDKSMIMQSIESKFGRDVDKTEGSRKDADSEMKELLRTREEELAEKMKDVLKDDAQIKISEQKIRIMLSSPVLFDLGNAELKSSSFPILHEVAELVRNIPNRIVVEGHTDNLPIRNEEFQSNWELSAARAFSVVRYFREKENLDAERLAGLGHGEFRSLVPNDSEENRSRNRRVEINIIRVSH